MTSKSSVCLEAYFIADLDSRLAYPRPRPRLGRFKTKTQQIQDQDQDSAVPRPRPRLTRPILEVYDWDKL